MSVALETPPAAGAPRAAAADSGVNRQVCRPPSAPNQSVPDEVLVSLSSTVGNRRTQGHTAHHRNCQCCGIRRPDAVWHHPIGRRKYGYFLEQPLSLTGAGRDISFLYDAIQRKTPLPPLNDKSGVSDKQNQSYSESLIPEEYHIVRNKGLQSLEFYEDRFTAKLQDDERNLRVFPSLKPSGRLEVVQLMRVMDDMLEKAGVDHQSEELSHLSQMEGLLKMVRTEQNIYNLVFHELIRQVSVGCAERGQLLAKLRQRYQSLLERIPLRLKALHTEAVAQRALDRRLTEEIHHLEASVQQLSTELSRIKEHDAFVGQQAEVAQRQLAEALHHTNINSDMLQGFQELYELQRRRLEAQLLRITEERDGWSQLTFQLALKVISVRELHLVDRLYVFEQSWFQTAEQCSVYITSKDTADMKAIAELTQSWKEQLKAFLSDQRKAEEAQCEQMSAVEQGITRWLVLCTQPNKSPGPKYELASMEEIHADLKQWSDMLLRQSERYQGEQLLSCQQRLGQIAGVQQRWLDKSRRLFLRHPGSGAEAPEGQLLLTELERLISQLHKHLHSGVNGENGIYRALALLLAQLGPWLDKLGAAIGRSQQLPACDWLQLEEALRSWQSSAEDICHRLSTLQTQNQKDDAHTEFGQVLNKLAEFMRRLSTFSECEKQRLVEEMGSLHTAQMRWMVELLLLMVPEPAHKQSPEQDLAAHLTNQALHKLEDHAKMLAHKLHCFSKHITSSYQLIVEEQLLQDPLKVEVENDLDECRKLQTESSSWLETSLILLSGMKEASMDGCGQEAELALSFDLPLSPAHSTHSLASREDSAEEDCETDVEAKEQGEPRLWENGAVKLTGSELGGSSQLLSAGRDEWVASPAAEDEAQKALGDDTAVGLLQQQLYEREQQIHTAQQRAFKAEEALQAALEKITGLERQLQQLSDPGPQNTQAAAEEKKTPLPPFPPPATHPASSNKSISEGKPASSTKKSKKH